MTQLSRSVDVSLDIHCKPHHIIHAFLDEKLLHLWWNVERSLIEKKVGGLYVLSWNVDENGFGYVSTGVLEAYDPSSCLIIGSYCYLNPMRSILGPMQLMINVRSSSSGSRMSLSQRGYQEGEDWEWYFESVKTAWPLVLQNFKSFMEERFPFCN